MTRMAGSMGRWIGCGALVAAVLVLAGCSETKSYIPICGPNDLSPVTRGTIARQIQALDSFDPDENKIGSRLTWIPLICLRYAANEVFTGAMAPEDAGLNVEASPIEQWVQAKEYDSVGPLAVLYVRWADAYFDLKGKNFGYSRTTLALWGLLWLDHESKEGEKTHDRTYITGFFLSAFGYERDERPEGTTRAVRFFWFPIPFARD